MTSLCVVSNFVSSLHPNPLWDGSVLLLFFSQNTLDDKCLVSSHTEGIRHQIGSLCVVSNFV